MKKKKIVEKRYLDNISKLFSQPCLHRGFCALCANQLETCPMCRASIKSISRQASLVSTNASGDASDGNEVCYPVMETKIQYTET